jgi:flagellar biosynthesis/type III secretory pathway protein FliH
MINVNMGKSQRLLSACKPLAEYSWLVAEVRSNNHSTDEDGMSSAVDRAISDMPDDFLIKPFLLSHRAEVKGMLLTEYNEAEQMEMFREEGREEGRAEGRAEGAESERINNIRSMMEALTMTAKQAMDVLKIPASEQPKYLSML